MISQVTGNDQTVTDYLPPLFTGGDGVGMTPDMIEAALLGWAEDNA